jgi:hypothetical protein
MRDGPQICSSSVPPPPPDDAPTSSACLPEGHLSVRFEDSTGHGVNARDHLPILRQVIVSVLTTRLTDPTEPQPCNVVNLAETDP